MVLWFEIIISWVYTVYSAISCCECVYKRIYEEGERDRQRKRDRERQRETERDRETERERQRDTERDIERLREKEKEALFESALLSVSLLIFFSSNI